MRNKILFVGFTLVASVFAAVGFTVLEISEAIHTVPWDQT